MKPLHLLCAGFALLLAFGACSRNRTYPDYSVSSGFTLDSLDACNPQVVENLEVLCRVWGYTKYHHPVFANSTVNIDYELFDLLPKVAKADSQTRNGILAAWIDSLGSFDSAPELYSSLPPNLLDSCQIDLGWTRDTARLGYPLSERLGKLRYADRSAGNRYVKKMYYPEYDLETPNAGFMGEASYDDITDPDCGYRLLAVFRFWNMVEYFFPYKHLTDKPWSDVLPEYIGRMIALSDGTYARTMWRMVAEINDSHAEYGALNSICGCYRVPLVTAYVEGRVVVAAPDTLTRHVSSGAGFRVGDEIVAVNGLPVEYYKRRVRDYVPCSNEERVCKQTADAILRSPRNTYVRVSYLRDGIKRDSLVVVSRDYRWLDYKYGPYADLGDGIAYIDPGSFGKKDAEPLAQLLEHAKGLVVDLRHYPYDGAYFRFVDEHIIRDDTLFRSKCQCYTYPVLSLPGVFTSSVEPESVWSRPYRSDYPIAVLVDNWTQSGGETGVQWLQTCRDAVVVGNRSAGANGNITHISLPGGFRTGFSGLGWYYSDGVTVQRRGVRIDIEVHPTLAGLRAGRDEILDKALEVLRKGRVLDN